MNNIRPNLTHAETVKLMEAQADFIFSHSTIIFGPDGLGSAVLASSHGYQGLLTAGHCAEMVFSSPQIALAASEKIHQFYIDCNELEHIPVEQVKDDGPDLSFIIFKDQSAVSEMKRAGKRFYDLDSANLSLLNLPVVKGHYCICGSPYEKLRNETFLLNNRAHDLVKTSLLAMMCNLKEIYDKGTHEYVDLTLFGTQSSYPDDYEGCSGSGIWYNRFNTIDGVNYTVHPVLAGIVAWQMRRSKRNPELRTITGHYARSIYKDVRQLLKARRLSDPKPYKL